MRRSPFEQFPAIAAGWMLTAPGWSDTAVPGGYRTVALENGIPPALLYAVALTESARPVVSHARIRPRPWTLNMAGRGVFFDSRLAAWRALTAWLEQGKRSVDIGLMQVSWRYHGVRRIRCSQTSSPSTDCTKCLCWWTGIWF